MQRAVTTAVPSSSTFRLESAVEVSILHLVVIARGAGSQLEPGLRRTLEYSLGTDLAAIRIHTGPLAWAITSLLGVPAATSGCDIFFARDAYQPLTQGGFRMLAHEVAHAVQQAQGLDNIGGGVTVGKGDSYWELAAEVAAINAALGRPAPAPVAQSPRPQVGGAIFLQCFNSWEHRLLGDVPTSDLYAISTKTGNWQQLVQQQVNLNALWRSNPDSVTREQMLAICPYLVIVKLERSGCLATAGELNAMGDYVATPYMLHALQSEYILPMLQQIRQESYNRLNALLGNNDSVNFAKAITGYIHGGPIETLKETNYIDDFTDRLALDHYKGLLARNACHFAPFAWYRWKIFHEAARFYATQAHGLPAGEQKTRLTAQAWMNQSFADHFIEDCFTAGHLTNKTLIMQWFIEWASDQTFLSVPNWGAVKHMTFANQPGLMGSQLYERGHAGLANDPQTAEEQFTFEARMHATGIKAADGSSQKEAYHQYLNMLEASVIQLSTNQVHNYFNDNSLMVASVNHPDPFQVWGDENLLKYGAAINIASGTVHYSQSVIQQILDTGSSSITVQDVLDRLPTYVQHRGGLMPLPQWHAWIKVVCMEDIFGGIASYLAFLMPYTGRVSVDQ